MLEFTMKCARPGHFSARICNKEAGGPQGSPRTKAAEVVGEPRTEMVRPAKSKVKSTASGSSVAWLMQIPREAVDGGPGRG